MGTDSNFNIFVNYPPPDPAAGVAFLHQNPIPGGGIVRLTFATAATAAFFIIIISAPTANSDVQPGCESVPWGFLGSQTRSICDGPIQADGSWVRYRMVWVPAHQVPLRTSCSAYGCTTSGGYYVNEQIITKEKYPVRAETVLPNEPGWLPPTYTDASGFTPVNFN